jgi:hypothetical protein
VHLGHKAQQEPRAQTVSLVQQAPRASSVLLVLLVQLVMLVLLVLLVLQVLLALQQPAMFRSRNSQILSKARSRIAIPLCFCP